MDVESSLAGATSATSREVIVNPQSTTTSGSVERIDGSNHGSVQSVERERSSRGDSQSNGSTTITTAEHKQEYVLEIRKLKERIQQLQNHHANGAVRSELNHNENVVSAVGSPQMPSKAESN